MKTPQPLFEKRQMAYPLAKRLFDIVFAAFFLVLFSPFFLLAALMIKASSPGPVFYRGVRVGQGGRLFRMFKFRTMVADAEKRGASSTAEDDPRLTPVGRFLRQYKLDEWPQLLNVLVGQMSFVGPRPQVEWATKLYTEEQKALLTVRPGITDYASIRFCNEAEILSGSSDPDRDYLERIAPEKIRLALEYVKKRSLAMDIKIIFATVAVLFGLSRDRIFRDCGPPQKEATGRVPNEVV
jgi:lipopolysaccharide/colanic/teichoic acid biosynthesis glycosyltransferase